MRKLLTILFLFLTICLNGQIMSGVVATKIAAATYPIILDDGNTEAWYEAKSAYLTLSGSEVTGWADKTANNVDLVNVDATEYPTFAGDSVTFDGSNDWLYNASFALAQPFTIYAVVNQITWTANDMILNFNVPYVQQRTATPTFRIICTASLPNSTATLTISQLYTVIFNGASSSSQINDAAAASGDAGAGDISRIHLASTSGGSAANVSYKELIIRSGSDSAENQTAIKNYLKSKYEIY